MNGKAQTAESAFLDGVHVVWARGKNGPAPMCAVLPRGTVVLCFTTRQEAESGAELKRVRWTHIEYYDPADLPRLAKLARSNGHGLGRCKDGKVREFEVQGGRFGVNDPEFPDRSVQTSAEVTDG